MQYKPLTVLITGASRGIGKALAQYYARLGWNLALIARDGVALEALRKDLLAVGAAKVAIATADVTQRDRIESAIRDVQVEVGSADIVYVNAGVSRPTDGAAFDVDSYFANIQTNLIGAVYTLGAVVPDMVARRSGQIVGVSSLASFTAMPVHAGYSASKVGLNRILQGLRAELQEFGIRVTTVCPGFVDTDMARRLGDDLPFFVPAEKAAECIASAVQRGAPYCLFPWQMALLIWAVRIVPESVVNFVIRKVFLPRTRRIV